MQLTTPIGLRHLISLKRSSGRPNTTEQRSLPPTSNHLIGKTKILLVALLVWPRTEKECSFTSTSPDFEWLLADADDTFLGLAVLSHNLNRGYAVDIQAASNGAGEKRTGATRQAKMRQPRSAQILSTHETRVSQLLLGSAYG